jgi:GTP-binding protein
MIANSLNLPLVVIFGRANVGKSTLFNRLIEKDEALISKIAGTTRDANQAKTNWRGYSFLLVDTGGIIQLKYLVEKKQPTDDIEAKVQKQARDYLSRADLILFLVDTRTGLLPDDKQIALFFKKNNLTTKTILVANKADNPGLRKETAEFNRLGLGEPLPISAANGSGTGDLLDKIISFLPAKTKTEEKKETIKIGIIGQPNVGKSSLLNAILGEEKVIVSPTPHTTREPQNTELVYQNKNIILIDTAGISKKGQASARAKNKQQRLEKLSIAKSLKILKQANIALLVIDITRRLTRQDARLVEEILAHKSSLIIVANKWDLITEKKEKKFKQYIYSILPFVRWAPIIFVSAKTGKKVKKILDLILEIANQRKQTISDKTLAKFLKDLVKRHPPTGRRGRHPYIYEIKQIDANQPIFVVRLRPGDNLNESYRRFIENYLREKFNFLGTPLVVYIEKRKEKRK